MLWQVVKMQNAIVTNTADNTLSFGFYFAHPQQVLPVTLSLKVNFSQFFRCASISVIRTIVLTTTRPAPRLFLSVVQVITIAVSANSDTTHFIHNNFFQCNLVSVDRFELPSPRPKRGAKPNSGKRRKSLPTKKPRLAGLDWRLM